jgi:hypothetical protein
MDDDYGGVLLEYQLTVPRGAALAGSWTIGSAPESPPSCPEDTTTTASAPVLGHLCLPIPTTVGRSLDPVHARIAIHPRSGALVLHGESDHTVILSQGTPDGSSVFLHKGGAGYVLFRRSNVFCLDKYHLSLEFRDLDDDDDDGAGQAAAGLLRYMPPPPRQAFKGSVWVRRRLWSTATQAAHVGIDACSGDLVELAW